MATPGESRGRGRPSDYTPQVAELICERLAAGETLTDICREDWAPNRTTVWRWYETHEEFCNAYARAREIGADAIVDEILQISDNDAGDVQRDRLRVDTRKWLAMKFNPRRYGDKTTTEIHGKDGGPIETTSPQDSLRWILFAMAAHKEDK